MKVRTVSGQGVPVAASGRPRRCLNRWRPYVPWIVAAAFTVSGPIHFASPASFTSIVPHFLPLRTELVYVSGLAEIICAIGLWRRRRWAGLASAVLLVAVWPANLQDAISAQQGNHLTSQVLDWVRFAFQIPLIWIVLQSGRTRPDEARVRSEWSGNDGPVPAASMVDAPPNT